MLSPPPPSSLPPSLLPSPLTVLQILRKLAQIIKPGYSPSYKVQLSELPLYQGNFQESEERTKVLTSFYLAQDLIVLGGYSKVEFEFMILSQLQLDLEFNRKSLKFDIGRITELVRKLILFLHLLPLFLPRITFSASFPATVPLH